MSFLSILVATYNREQNLRVTLDCLADQPPSHDKYEVLVMDNGAPGVAEEMARDYMTSVD